MKIKMYYLSVLLLVLACRKENEQLSGDSPMVSKIKAEKEKSILRSPFNTSNPADSVGITHNQVLQYVYEKMVANNDSSAASKRRYVVSFFKKKYGTDISSSLAEKDILYKPFKMIDIRRLPALYKNSSAVSVYLTKIIGATYILRKTNGYDQFYKLMIELENKIGNDKKTLSLREREQLFHVASIARHSSWFWMNFIGERRGQTAEGFFRSVFRAFLGLQADLHNAVWALITFQEYRNLQDFAADESAGALWYFDAFM